MTAALDDIQPATASTKVFRIVRVERGKVEFTVSKFLVSLEEVEWRASVVGSVQGLQEMLLSFGALCLSQQPSQLHASVSPQSQHPPGVVLWNKTSWPVWSLSLKQESHCTQVGSDWQVLQFQAMSPGLKTYPHGRGCVDGVKEDRVLSSLGNFVDGWEESKFSNLVGGRVGVRV
eukprot:CAMPEP_0118632708 /NCGR_PEP_ID=MMETSP0785-20121206/593_1 /TAXON_ID=91992 /ORGANISM="Bolidomonas pacifica, Strain CCMP 1866" /LENGTH=174 /DNA_ID=CAMNT_0006523505 /DNA_START=131 /DNA_END=655 /DNA_ORIENTATION=+